MTSTTITVSTETRDRLKAQASAVEVTLGVSLSHLADAADRALRFESMRTAVAVTPPEAMAGYGREAEQWVDADLDA